MDFEKSARNRGTRFAELHFLEAEKEKNLHNQKSTFSINLIFEILQINKKIGDRGLVQNMLPPGSNLWFLSAGV